MPRSPLATLSTMLLLLCLASPALAQERTPPDRGPGQAPALSPAEEVYTLLRRLAHLLAPTPTPTPTPQAAPSTYYVSPQGNDSHTCAQAQSLGTPKGTINAGIACLRAGAGDILMLRGGTYNTGIDWHTQVVPGGTSWATATTIASYAAEKAILRPTSPPSSAVITVNQPYIIFDRLVVDAYYARYGLATGGRIRFQYGEIMQSGGSRTPSVPFNPGQDESELVEMFGDDNEVLYSELHHTVHSYGFYVNGQRNKIIGNTIHDNGGFAIQIYDGNFPNTSVNDTVVMNNIMYNNGAFRQYGAVTVGHGSNNQITQNLIYNNYGGIWVYKSGTNTLVQHNTLVNNTHWGIQVYWEATSARVQNNLLSGNGANSDESGDTTYTANLCTAAGVGCTLIGQPLFVDPASRNYQLQAGSPAIDAGVAIATVPTDLAGIPRPQGAASDIGAYEFVSGTPVPPEPPVPPTAASRPLACTGTVAAVPGAVTMTCVPSAPAR